MKGSKKSPQQGQAPPLDLGLGGIISSVPEPAPARAEGGNDPGKGVFPSQTAVSAERPGSARPPVAAPPRSEYAALAERGEWGKLLNLTEQRTAGGGHGELEPRFWWVRASVALGSVPLSILAAPLDTVTAEIVDLKKQAGGKVSEELREAAALLLTEVSANLLGNGDFATALTFAERAHRILPASQEHLVAVIARILELPEPSARRDPAGVRLRTRCQKLREELGGAPLQPPRKVAPNQAPPPRNGGRLTPTSQAGRGATPAPRPASSLGPLVVLVGVLIGGAVVYKLTQTQYLAPVGETAMSLIAHEYRPTLGAPAVERLTALSQLDAIFYDIDRGGERAALSRPTTAAAPASGSSRSSVKEVVNTQGPREPREVYQALQSPRPDGASEEDVGAILFGAPKPRLPLPRGGDDPRPLGVERFDDTREFEVIARTKVLTRPSFTGSPVAGLVVGDRVRAEGAVGDWLKIRSRNGQVGYILSQDVKAAR